MPAAHACGPADA